MFSGILTATVVKTETGSLPEGKVKIKLEHDGTVLDVDEDDVEKVSFAGLGYRSYCEQFIRAFFTISVSCFYHN